jgi:hypothetical protein
VWLKRFACFDLCFEAGGEACPVIGTGSIGDIIFHPLVMCGGNPGGLTPWHKLGRLLLVNRATTKGKPVHSFFEPKKNSLDNRICELL